MMLGVDLWSGMITSDITPAGILVVQPVHPLRRVDFHELVGKVDPWIEEHGALRGLLIDAPKFPGWENFAGFQSHLCFVKNHHRTIRRIAVASESAFLTALPAVARHFVKAEIRRFDAGEKDEALRWLESPLPDPPHAIRHSWFPDEKLLWMWVDGKVTTSGYRKFLARLEQILSEVSPISVMIDLDDLEGTEPGAVLSDLKFGLTHLKSFDRMALIGEDRWIHRLAKIPNPFPFEIKAFTEKERHTAWDWLRE